MDLTPNVSGAFWNLTSDNQFALLEKKIVDFELVETNVAVAVFEGNLQPDRDREVVPLREGERNWKFWRLRTTKELPPDSIVADKNGLQYRVMGSGDWEAGGYFSYRLDQQPPQGAAAAPYATGQIEPIKVVAMALKDGLGLADDAVVLAYEKNIVPQRAGLYVSLDYLGPAKCLGNVNETNPVSFAEIQSTSYQHLVQIDLLSYDASARRRKEEATMAIYSQYCQRLQDRYVVSISRNPGPWVDASSLEPTKRLNRFTSTVKLFSVHRRTLPVPPYYDTFPGQITEGGPLKPFAPAPILEARP